jgi:hypothetical protein
MKALLMLLVATLPLFAQQPAAAPATPPAAPPATPPAAAPATPPAAPASSDDWFSGYIDLGYRWQTGVGGSLDTYRSFVDLGSGPKLVGADFTIGDPQHRFFDQIAVRAFGWGDDPNESLHIDIKKKKLYNFDADYRDMAYFNYLPSYADPLLSTTGIALNEQSFDTRRRFANFNLELLPGNWLVPYVSYDDDAGSGTGETTFVNDANEFAVPNSMSDRTSLFRGGVRIELKHFHVTLEEGGTTFKSSQDLYQPSGSTNLGNLMTTFLGQTIDLTGLAASYGIKGSGTFTKGLFTANAASWLDLYGQFLYSDPSTNVNYTQLATGNLVLENQLLFYSSQQFLLTSAAQSPHTSGSFGAEIRPFRKIRIVESWLTDRTHESGAANSNETLGNPYGATQMAALLASSLVSNYNQEEVDVFYDPTSRLMLHGGYRYVWGNANDATLPVAGLASSDQGSLSRNVGIAGISFRPSQTLLVSGNLEAASSGGAYFRTSLYNYQKWRAQARYQVNPSLSVAADFSLLNNQNPLPTVKYDCLASQESLSFLWAPQSGKHWNFQGSYSRSSIYSDISYFNPEFLTPEESLYRDNAHTASALFTANVGHYYGLTPTVSAGGSLFISSGSRPTNYYQPFAKVVLPVRKSLSWFSEWSYYGYGEAFYLYEGFRTHLIMTGLRFSR